MGEIKNELNKTYIEFMAAFVNISTEDKRKEVIAKVKELIATIVLLNKKLGLSDELLLNKEIYDLEKEPVSEDDYLEAVFALLNCLENEIGKYLNKIIY